MIIRQGRRKDRPALGALGHPPDVLDVLCPAIPTRLAWSANGVRARTFVALEEGAPDLLGSVQLVRSRLDRSTWMFGHWRVATARRGAGIGRHLLQAALTLVPEVRRLYSLVEAGNAPSARAHAGLDFQPAAERLGTVPLGVLTTMGPPAPAVRLEKIVRRDHARLFEVYRQAMGPVWMALFPGLSAGRFVHATIEPLESNPSTPPPRNRRLTMFEVYADGGRHAFVARRPGRLQLFVEPAYCDAGLLSRVAGALVARGFDRSEEVAIRGLPGPLVRQGGPIRVWTLMGAPDTTALRR